MKLNDFKLIAAAVGVLILGIIIGRIFQRIKDGKSLKDARENAIKKSRAVISGQFAEQIAPFLPDFPCNPGDCRFIGKPIDFIAFPGSADGKEIKEVLLIEVKTGQSQLSERERQIEDAVKKGKVRYVVWRSK